MKLTVWLQTLPLARTFTISRSSSEETENVFLRVEHDGIAGLGETSPSSFYGHTPASTKEALEGLAPWLESVEPTAFRLVLEEARERLDGNRAALCALDLALLDWIGKRRGLPLWRMLGLRPAPLPPTTYTVGIDSIDQMIDNLRERRGHPVFKIKLGRGDDIEKVEALRRETRAPFRVDANCAWTADETIEKSKALARLGVEFIEQPLPRDRLGEMERVMRESALPIIADENGELPEHVPSLRGRFHGINVKLVKCGGVLPALRMLETAREIGLRTMLGCMLESSLLITGAAHLGSLLDYADLDGPLLLARDPFRGIRIDQGRLTLPEGPGLGVVEA